METHIFNFLSISEHKNCSKKYQPFLRREICPFTMECSACVSRVCSEQPEGRLCPYLLNKDMSLFPVLIKCYKIIYKTNFLQLVRLAWTIFVHCNMYIPHKLLLFLNSWLWQKRPQAPRTSRNCLLMGKVAYLFTILKPALALDSFFLYLVRSGRI